jgi:hypothetical protein
VVGLLGRVWLVSASLRDNKNDAITMCPRTMCSQNKSLGHSVPRTMSPLGNAALEYCVAWTWRPLLMCPDPVLHPGTCQYKLHILAYDMWTTTN